MSAQIEVQFKGSVISECFKQRGEVNTVKKFRELVGFDIEISPQSYKKLVSVRTTMSHKTRTGRIAVCN